MFDNSYSRMWSLGMLPFLVWVGTAVALRRRTVASLRDCLVAAGVNTAVWAVAGTELLSLFGALSFWPLLLWWLAPVLLAGRAGRMALPVLPEDRMARWAWGIVALFLVITLVSGLLVPPTNWDALAYHLPRQVYWMQQGHVGFFSTNDTRMLTMPPLAEYIGVQLMILSGGDYWIHGIQWLAYALCAVTASVIARDLGVNARWQALAALLVVCIPPAALQASNAKNDVVTAFFLCALASFGLKILQPERLTAYGTWLLGAAGGLLVLSKGTGMIFGLPAALWILAALWHKQGWRQTLRVSAMAGVIAATITVGFVVRVYSTFDSPLARGKGQSQIALRNTVYTPQALLSNLLRNSAMHLATDSSRINPRLTSVVTTLHRWIGMDINDPRTTYAPSPPYEAELALKKEDLAKAPVHVLWGMAALVMVMARARKEKALTTTFLLLPYAALFAFCFLLAWQIWHSRLHIPVLCLLSPMLALTGARWPKVGLVACGLAALLGLYSAAFNQSKPVLGKASVIISGKKRFKTQPQDAREAAEAAAEVCRRYQPQVIGLAAQATYCEYVLLRTLLRELEPNPHFVKLNLSWRKAGPRPEPDLVLTWNMPANQMARLRLTNYSRVFSTNLVEVLVKK